MTATADGRSILNGKFPSLIKAMPVDGLHVGTDTGGLVGNYPADFRYNGELESILVELGRNDSVWRGATVTQHGSVALALVVPHIFFTTPMSSSHG